MNGSSLGNCRTRSTTGNLAQKRPDREESTRHDDGIRSSLSFRRGSRGTLLSAVRAVPLGITSQAPLPGACPIFLAPRLDVVAPKDALEENAGNVADTGRVLSLAHPH